MVLRFFRHFVRVLGSRSGFPGEFIRLFGVRLYVLKVVCGVPRVFGWCLAIFLFRGSGHRLLLRLPKGNERNLLLPDDPFPLLRVPFRDVGVGFQGWVLRRGYERSRRTPRTPGDPRLPEQSR